MTKIIIFLFISVTAMANPLNSKYWKSSFNLSMDSRIFSDDNKNSTNDQHLSLLGELKTRYKGSFISLRMEGKFLIDQYDEDRSYHKFTDAYANFKLTPFRLFAGYRIYNYSVLEFFHPMDFINARSVEISPTQFERFGELSAGLSVNLGTFNLEAVAFLDSSDNVFPGANNRMNPSSVTLGASKFLNDNARPEDEPNTPGFLFKLKQSTDVIDYSIYYFSLVDKRRNSPYVENITDIRPLYFINSGFGVTAEIEAYEYLFKIEASSNSYKEKFSESVPILGPQNYKKDDHIELAFGLEKSYPAMKGHEITALLEYSLIIPKESSVESNEIGLFQNDLAIGFRYSLNDINSSNLDFFFITDNENPSEYVAQISWSSRLSDKWGYSIGLLTLDSDEDSNSVNLSSFKHSDFAFINLEGNF